MKACLFFVVSLFSVAAYSQNTINAYKYVLVPERFDFSREDNQYGLNTTARLLLEQKGFAAFMTNDQLPPALAANRCNALRAEVVQKKGLFVTNLTLLLKDCQGNIVFKSKEGKSREKEFLPAYDEALRNAFASLNELPYKYDSTLMSQQGAPTPAVATATPAPAAPAPSMAPVGEITGTLYAQVTPNGYQLIDTSPRKILTLLKTSLPDYYIAQAGASSGVVFKKDGDWVFEYYKDDRLVSKKLEIKF